MKKISKKEALQTEKCRYLNKNLWEIAERRLEEEVYCRCLTMKRAGNYLRSVETANTAIVVLLLLLVPRDRRNVSS